MKRLSAIVLAAGLAWGQGRIVETVAVVSRPASTAVQLTGEIFSFEQVSLTARVAGIVDEIRVDRGSTVKKGDVLVKLKAPELAAQLAEAQAREQTLEAARLEAQAQLAASESSLARLRKAAETPGAISPNELEQSEKAVDAARAYLQARTGAMSAAKASVTAAREMEQYLSVAAPFDGVVTQRFVDPGALVGPGKATLEVQDVARLRLVVAVPEENAGSIRSGARIEFSVPAFPAATFAGTITRNPRTLDPKTRSLAVELDVVDRSGKLAPGMLPQVTWPVEKGKASLLVPPTCVVSTAERTFVIRVKNGRAEWVTVRKGDGTGELVEVIGALAAGDRVVRQARDGIADGMLVVSK